MHNVTATYSGDTNDIGSTSTVFTQTVSQITVTALQTPSDSIKDLIDTINNMNINHGQTDQLDKYLNTAINYLNIGDNRTCGKLSKWFYFVGE